MSCAGGGEVCGMFKRLGLKKLHTRFSKCLARRRSHKLRYGLTMHLQGDFSGVKQMEAKLFFHNHDGIIYWDARIAQGSAGMC